MAAKTKTMESKQFEAALDDVIEKIILNERITLEDYAIISAAQDYPDHIKMAEVPVKSKMYYCNFERRALDKMKLGLARYGINKLSDVMDLNRDRRWASEVAQ